MCRLYDIKLLAELSSTYLTPVYKHPAPTELLLFYIELTLS
jgi:hypothetical protein